MSTTTDRARELANKIHGVNGKPIISASLQDKINATEAMILAALQRERDEAAMRVRKLDTPHIGSSTLISIDQAIAAIQGTELSSKQAPQEEKE